VSAPRPADLDAIRAALEKAPCATAQSWLRAGLLVRLVAVLHDTSSAMIEKHYAAGIIDAFDELAAGGVVPLVSKSASIVALRGSADADVPQEASARR
jgi:hypothetical protein